MAFFDKGSLLKHKNLQLTARILDVKDGKYQLAWVKKDLTDFLTDYALRGTWDAVQLVNDFVPLVHESRWDRLLDGSSALNEDAYTLRVKVIPNKRSDR